MFIHPVFQFQSTTAFVSLFNADDLISCQIHNHDEISHNPLEWDSHDTVLPCHLKEQPTASKCSHTRTWPRSTSVHSQASVGKPKLHSNTLFFHMQNFHFAIFGFFLSRDIILTHFGHLNVRHGHLIT